MQLGGHNGMVEALWKRVIARKFGEEERGWSSFVAREAKCGLVEGN